MTPAEAVALQRQLAAAVETADRFGSLDRVAGVDVGFEDGGRITRAAVAVLDAATLVLTDWAIARRPTARPPIPALLSFRELPAILDAVARLDTHPAAGDRVAVAVDSSRLASTPGRG